MQPKNLVFETNLTLFYYNYELENDLEYVQSLIYLFILRYMNKNAMFNLL